MREGLVVDLSLNEAGFGGLSSSFYYPYILLQGSPRNPGVALRRTVGADHRGIAVHRRVLPVRDVKNRGVGRDDPHLDGPGRRTDRGVRHDPCRAVVSGTAFPAAGCADRGGRHDRRGGGQETLGFIVERAGWRVGMIACAVFSTVLLVLIVLFVRNRRVADGAGDPVWPRFSAIGRLLLSADTLPRHRWRFGVLGGCGLRNALGVSYFQVHHHESAGGIDLCVLLLLGLPPGFLGSAWLCARLGRPALLLGLGAAGTAAAMGLILFVLHGPVALAVAMFVLERAMRLRAVLHHGEGRSTG